MRTPSEGYVFGSLGCCFSGSCLSYFQGPTERKLNRRRLYLSSLSKGLRPDCVCTLKANTAIQWPVRNIND